MTKAAIIQEKSLVDNNPLENLAHKLLYNKHVSKHKKHKIINLQAYILKPKMILKTTMSSRKKLRKALLKEDYFLLILKEFMSPNNLSSRQRTLHNPKSSGT